NRQNPRDPRAHQAGTGSVGEVAGPDYVALDPACPERSRRRAKACNTSIQGPFGETRGQSPNCRTLCAGKCYSLHWEVEPGPKWRGTKKPFGAKTRNSGRFSVIFIGQQWVLHSPVASGGRISSELGNPANNAGFPLSHHPRRRLNNWKHRTFPVLQK